MSEATPDSDMQLPKTANLESEGGPRETSGSAMGPTKQSDSNEERKDRIARLLAAKGTKQAAVPSETAVKPLSSLPTPSSVSAKALSEKSKLLRQKMEALQRSREAQLHGPGPESGPGHGNVGDTQNGTSTMLSETAVAPSLDQTQVPPQGGSTQSPPPIPGLFLSSTSTVKRPSSTSQQKRPAASDLNDTSDIPFKRPFGQSRQTQPFLIDVSDDEDDEAMDLDSPELKPASANRPSSPFKIPPFRDLHTAPTNHLDRQMSSPMPTPPSNYSGRGDLKSMNKEIEAMKKKIAEAEARKKAKLSRPTSPAMGQTDNPRRVGSAASSIPLTSAEDSGAEGGSPQPPAEPESRRLPKVSEKRRDGQRGSSRSRSRAASERLPIIEAHRREQLMKLQALQTQVKRMEEEIEDSLLEEHRLREEAVAASNSGEDDTESPSSEPAPGKLLN